VIVLDEPTAGLDAAAETAFFLDLREAVRGRTVVLATHAALPPGAVDRCCELRAGRLHELSCGAAILA
jgi:ATP-binding cassette subfamily C protein CydC